MITKSELQLVCDALRSGKYQQTYGSMYGPSSRYEGGPLGGCALGIMAWVLSGGTPERFTLENAGKVNPERVLDGKISSHIGQMIMALNDREHMPFRALADWMERYVPTVLDPKEASRRDYERWKFNFLKGHPMHAVLLDEFPPIENKWFSVNFMKVEEAVAELMA
jgi:hypothetical protein